MDRKRFYGGRQCDECYRLNYTINGGVCSECHDGCNGRYCQRHRGHHVCDPDFVQEWIRHCEGKVSTETIDGYYIKHNLPKAQRRYLRHHASQEEGDA